MSKLSGWSPAMEAFLTDTLSHETADQRALRLETAAMPNAMMQISPDQGAVLALLVRLIGARRVLEIGTFTGYSSLAMALALPADGQLVACDVSDEWTSTARRYWAQAGVADRVSLRLAPALETLQALEAEGASFDLAFIDANKNDYPAYYAQCLRLVRPGGIIALDNMLWHGQIAAPDPDDSDGQLLRQLNLDIYADARVDAAMLTVGDGLLVARVR